MGFFDFGRKKDRVQSTAEQEAAVKILGSGCDKCRALEKATIEALEELGRDTAVEHVTDFAQIAQYGVMQIPALVVDGKVLSSCGAGLVHSRKEGKWMHYSLDCRQLRGFQQAVAGLCCSGNAAAEKGDS